MGRRVEKGEEREGQERNVGSNETVMWPAEASLGMLLKDTYISFYFQCGSACNCCCFTNGFWWWQYYWNFSDHYHLCYGRLQSECLLSFLHLYGLGTHLTQITGIRCRDWHLWNSRLL